MVRSDYSHTEAEKTILGFDYLEVSLLIADSWHFPERLVNIIRGCRQGEIADFKEPEPAVVCLASAMAQRQSADNEIHMRDWRHGQSAQTFLELEPDRVEEIDRGAREAVKNYRDMLAEAQPAFQTVGMVIAVESI